MGKNTKPINRQRIMGWIAVGITIAISSLWAFWGIIENFHEGWYYESTWMNLAMMFGQYLGLPVIFTGLGLVSIRWRRVGSVLHLLMGIAVLLFFKKFTIAIILLITTPFVLIGLLYWFGRPEPRRTALLLTAGLPLITAVIFGIEPVIRVSGRINDGDLGTRVVEGNGITLNWAPAGPGYPQRGGLKWDDAVKRCLYLVENGTSLADSPQNIWHLPTVDEAVRSMYRHGKSAGGIWDAQRGKATYQIMPDKESPLWNIYSMVIYWWTETEIDNQKAYMIVYNGEVYVREKQFAPDYFGFRCVKPAQK